MGRKLVYGEPIEMDEEESARFTEMEEQAERDAEREISENRLRSRWSKEQRELIRRAAGILGLTYATYVKQAAIRQALADLSAAREAGLAERLTD